MLSVICPVYNEEKYIRKCIASVLQQDYPKDDLEIIFTDGMSTDHTRRIIEEYVCQYPFIRIIDNPQRIVPTGLNAAIKEAEGDYIIRIDAHTEFPINYFSRLIQALNELGADNVGGVCLTLPASDASIPKAIAAVLSSKFGMGNSLFRVGVNEIREVDTVPFGCWHRELFDRIGGFDIELIRNQDDEFNGRLIKNGGKIYLLPDLEIKYYARDKISKVAKMFYQYGLFKPLVNKKLGAPATIRQFFPPIFVLGLFGGGLLSLLSPLLMILYIIGVGLYVFLAFLFSFAYSHNVFRILLQMYIYFIVHVSYGFGYFQGLWKLIVHKTFSAKANR